MRLTVLGSGTAIPHRARGASGYACVAENGSVLLLECGPGSTRQWPSIGLDLPAAQIIAVSHHHVDHCGDLAAVLFGRNVPPIVETPLHLLGPVGHREFITRLEVTYGSGVEDRARSRTVVDLGDKDSYEYSGFTIEARVVRHTPHALGFRVRADGRTLAFSGDSGPCDALVELCRGVDLALLECSFPSSYEHDMHLNTSTAARVALDAGVRRLALTHFYPECDGSDIEQEVRAAGYHGDLSLAHDGVSYDV